MAKDNKYDALLTFSPLSLDTCLFSLMSHLFPKIIFSTSADACWVEHIQENGLAVKYSNSTVKDVQCYIFSKLND